MVRDADRQDIPRIRADAVTSLGAGVFGTSLMVTSAENIGIVQLTRVRSRFVTAGAGVLLILCGLNHSAPGCSPPSRSRWSAPRG